MTIWIDASSAQKHVGDLASIDQREVVNYALDGTKLHLLLQFPCCPTMNATGRWCRPR